MRNSFLVSAVQVRLSVLGPGHQAIMHVTPHREKDVGCGASNNWAPARSSEARRQTKVEKVIHNGYYSIIRARGKTSYRCARLLKLKVSPALVPLAPVTVTISFHLLTFLRHLFSDHV
jgi:hypothetical protein